jgi:predicted component of type VI protein secretion system
VLEEKRYLEYAEMLKRETPCYLELIIPGFVPGSSYGPSYDPVEVFNYEECGKDHDKDYA